MDNQKECECKKCLDCIFAEIDRKENEKLQLEKDKNLALLKEKGYFICDGCGCKSKNKGVYHEIVHYKIMRCRRCEIEDKRQTNEDMQWYDNNR